MNRNAIEVGAFSWAKIRRLYDTDAVVLTSDVDSALR
jgi:hypothetical protein